MLSQKSAPWLLSLQHDFGERRTGRKKALVAGLIGDPSEARAELDAAKVPCYATPAEAARSLMHLA
ncbi:MAG: hypothetical protein VX963_07240, partial [Actinomycetota bacterium]|nr:hypothetical protein [Actinomycetota bacterium]